MAPDTSATTYSVGQLEVGMRWGDTVFMAEQMCVPFGITFGRAKGDTSRLTIDEVQGEMLSKRKSRFPFTTLPIMLQVRIVSMLSYLDLKVLERTSLYCRKLVASENRILDATLFRTKLESVDLLKRKGLSRAKHGTDFTLHQHPIIGRIKGLFNEDLTWDTLTLRLKGSCRRKYRKYDIDESTSEEDIYEDEIQAKTKRRLSRGPRRYLLRNLHEIKENATQPPCARITLSYSSKRPIRSFYDDYGDEDESMDEDNAAQPVPILTTTIEGSKDASGVAQPVTVEQFVKGALEALSKEPGYGRELGGWVFVRWASRVLDDQGTLHLSEPEWKRKKQSTYYGFPSSDEGIFSSDEYASEYPEEWEMEYPDGYY